VTPAFLFVGIALEGRPTAVIDVVLMENVISIEKPKGDIVGVEKGEMSIEGLNNVVERD
jgi:hypothetical protein